MRKTITSLFILKDTTEPKTTHRVKCKLAFFYWSLKEDTSYTPLEILGMLLTFSRYQLGHHFLVSHLLILISVQACKCGALFKSL